MKVPKRRQSQNGEEPGCHQTRIHRSQAVSRYSEKHLGLGRKDPGRNACGSGDLTLMMLGKILREGMVQRKNPERSRGDGQQHDR